MKTLYRSLKKRNKALALKIKGIYLKTIKPTMYGRTKEVDVFLNPSPSDVKDIKNAGSTYVRFIADKRNQKLYIWGGSLAMHEDVGLSLGMRYVHGTDDYIPGEADIEGFTLKLNNDYDLDLFLKLSHEGWEWVKKYIRFE